MTEPARDNGQPTASDHRWLVLVIVAIAQLMVVLGNAGDRGGDGAMTRVALALPGVRRAEIHCAAANAASAAIPRKLGYRLDRVEMCRPGAPGESGRLMVWVRDAAGTG